MLEHVRENHPSTLTPLPTSQSEWQLGWLILNSGESDWWILTTVLHQFPRKSHQNATRTNTNLQSLQVQIIWGFIWVSPSYTKYLMQIYALDMDHRQGSMLWWSQNPMMPRCRGSVGLGWVEYESIMSTWLSVFWYITFFVVRTINCLLRILNATYNGSLFDATFSRFDCRTFTFWELDSKLVNLGFAEKTSRDFWIDGKINQNDAFVFAGHACPNLEVRSRHQAI